MSKETESRALTVVLFLHKMLRGAKNQMTEVTSEGNKIWLGTQNFKLQQRTTFLAPLEVSLV